MRFFFGLGGGVVIVCAGVSSRWRGAAWLVVVDLAAGLWRGAFLVVAIHPLCAGAQIITSDRLSIITYISHKCKAIS